MDARGFSLAEVLIAVVVVGILAAMALPRYGRTVERGYWRAAQDILQTVYSGEQVYEAANGTYVNPATCAPAWRCIYVDNPNTGAIPVTFLVGGVSATTFTARATRKVGVFMTIDQNRNLNTARWPMP
jgi:type IV pilus assembly protein PilE